MTPTEKPERQKAMTTKITIENYSRNHFAKFFKKLARKCTRLSIENAPTYTILEDTVREVDKVHMVQFEGDTHSHKYQVTVVDVEVTVPEPVRMAGQWECFAVMERNENGTMEAMTTGHKNHQDAKTFIASGNMCCGHCNTKRVRNTTMLFRNEDTGAMMQVGKECAKEYGSDAALLMAQFEFISIITSIHNDGEGYEEFWHGGGVIRMNRVLDMDEVLDLLAVDQIKLARPFVKTYHWDEVHQVNVPNSNSTKNTINRMMTKWCELEEKPCSEARAKLDEIVKYFISLPTEELEASEYLADLATALGNDYVSERKLGLVVSMVKSYNAAIVKKEAVVPTNPAPAGKMIVKGRIASTKEVSSDWGTTWKMLVVLVDGNKVWCSIPEGVTGDNGEEVTFKATFERSSEDKHFAFGSRPSLKINKKDLKTLPAII